MALSKLGDYIELLDNRNVDLEYGIEYVRGVNNLKQLMPTKADVSGRDLTKFYIVYPGDFVFNHRTSRNGSKFSIAYNDGDEPVICTEDYVVFRVKAEYQKTLHARWLYMYFNRPEFDRYVIANSWGSSTEFYNWEDICEVELLIPQYDVQQKYVDVYEAMLENQRSYERGLNDLKLSCDGYMDVLKKKEQTCIGEYITITDVRNTSNDNFPFKGLSMENFFIDSIANEVGLDFSKYKKVHPGEFACVLMKVGRDCRLTVAHNTSDEIYLISPAYYTFVLSGIDASYFMAYISRTEFERRAWFSCDTSARGSLPWEEFCNLTIPKASVQEQKVVSNLYQVYINRISINEKLKAQIKELCPILIKGSIEEAME